MRRPVAAAWRACAALLVAMVAGAGTAAGQTAVATFAGGCFWCMEEAFDEVPGVISTTSGYTGGDVADPDYLAVASGRTGHAEAVRVEYDPARVSYEQLLVAFWHNVDPLDAGGQFCDRGSQYRSTVFVHSQEQRRLAEESRAYLDARAGFPSPVVTPVEAAGVFYPAEDYHQDYHRTNPVRYRFYKFSCGRAERLQQLWGPKPGGS